MISVLLLTFFTILGFRETCRQVAASCFEQQGTKPRNSRSTWMVELRLRRFLHVQAVSKSLSAATI
jgi:hypothetical protein